MKKMFYFLYLLVCLLGAYGVFNYILKNVLKGKMKPVMLKSEFLEPNYVGRYSMPFHYDVEVKINSHGFKGKEFEEKSGFRIITLGDSFTNGLESDYPWPYLLGDILGNEVLNLGVPGTGTDSALDILRNIGLELNPDLVVLGFFNHNDWQDNIKEKFSYKSNYFKAIIKGLSVKYGFADSVNYPPFFEESKKTTKEIIRAMAWLAVQNGFRFIVVVLPSRIETNVHKKYEDEIKKPYVFLRDICLEFDVGYIEILDNFLEYKNKSELFYLFDGHYSPEGHRLAAKSIYDKIGRAQLTESQIL